MPSGSGVPRAVPGQVREMNVLEELKQEVFEANLKLVECSLAIPAWGNASAITPDRWRVVFTPSGVNDDIIKPEQMMVTDMDSVS